MKLHAEGSDRVGLTPEEVARALRDPAVLARAVPGGGEMERTGPRVATVITTTGIAGTRGSYRARVHVVDATDQRFVLRIAAAGEPGTIEAELTVELHDDAGGTRVDHRLAATLDGRLAGLGHHVLEGAVAAGASRFLADLEAAVRAPAPVVPSATSPSSSVLTSGGSPTSPLVAPGGVGGAPVSGRVPGRVGSSVRTALITAAASALLTALALRWWQGREDA